jgi:hypothetical protein
VVAVVSDPGVEFAAFEVLRKAERPDEYVTDPDEIAELRRRYGYLPKRRREPVVPVVPARELLA